MTPEQDQILRREAFVIAGTPLAVAITAALAERDALAARVATLEAWLRRIANDRPSGNLPPGCVAGGESARDFYKRLQADACRWLLGEEEASK